MSKCIELRSDDKRSCIDSCFFFYPNDREDFYKQIWASILARLPFFIFNLLKKTKGHKVIRQEVRVSKAL